MNNKEPETALHVEHKPRHAEEPAQQRENQETQTAPHFHYRFEEESPESTDFVNLLTFNRLSLCHVSMFVFGQPRRGDLCCQCVIE